MSREHVETSPTQEAGVIEKRGYVPPRGPEPQPQSFSNLPTGPAPGAAPVVQNQNNDLSE
jgi:hypothetical protein